jgi:hypothetical protein
MMVEPSSDHELSDLTPVGVVGPRTAHETTAAEEGQSENVTNPSSTALEQNLTVIIKHIPKFMVASRRRARKARAQRKKARKVTLNKACTIISFILTVVALAFSIYGLYHWNGPANVISQESLDATDLGNYYTYIWTGCPALEVRNNRLLPF